MGCGASGMMPAENKPKTVCVEYFNVHGRAQSIIQMCAHSMIKPEKKEFTLEQWGGMKGKGDYKVGGLPHVIVDGKRFQETTPMLRMIGMRCGLYQGATPEMCHANDANMENLNNTLGKSNAYFFNPEAPKDKVDEWKKEVGPMWMAMEAKMKECGWSYLAGN